MNVAQRIVDLKPCPFCAKAPTLTRHTNPPRVECLWCGIGIEPRYDDRERDIVAAIKRWNRRPERTDG